MLQSLDILKFKQYCLFFFPIIDSCRGTCDIMVIVIGSGLGCPTSNPELGCLHFT